MKAALLVACVALAGCKKKSDEAAPPDPYKRMLARSAELGEQMCACKDQPCAEKVMKTLEEFLREQKALTVDKPTPDFESRMRPIEQRIQMCFVKANMPPEPVAKPVPAVPKDAQRIGELVKAARDRATERDKRLVLSKLVASYVKADGTLDKTYGTLELVFKMPPLKDDPDRPIGAPPPKASPDNDKTDCPTWTLQTGKWAELTGACAPDKELAPAKCTVEQVWSKAIEDKAPDTALATLVLDIVNGKQSWLFTIEDKARNVAIAKTFADDCVVQLEKPKPGGP